MATERQIEANRLNGQRCTGPKTLEGKAVASRNRVTHGLTSASGLLPGEKLEDFSDLRDRVLAELAPDRAIEMELAERIASLLWRLRRVPAFEAALLAWTHACKEEASIMTPNEPRLINWRDRDRPRPAAVHDILAFGRSLDGFLKGGVGGRLSRYENALQRSLSASMLELRRMQQRRKVQGSRDVCVGAAPGRRRRRHTAARVHGARRRDRRSRSRGRDTPPGLKRNSLVSNARSLSGPRPERVNSELGRHFGARPLYAQQRQQQHKVPVRHAPDRPMSSMNCGARKPAFSVRGGVERASDELSQSRAQSRRLTYRLNLVL